MSMKSWAFSSAAVILWAPAGYAAAQAAVPAPEGRSTGELEEVVVTARKLVENNQDAPATIVAVSGAEIAQRGVTDPQALEKFLPSANLRRQGPVTQVFIRGVGTRNDSPNFAAASALIFNGLIVPRYGTHGLTTDLESVQSIAGPQGTLYGGSAAGGVINLFSARPTGDNSGSAQLELGNLQAVHASANQNFAISDTLSLRAAVDYVERDSYYSAGLFEPKDLTARIGLLAKPNDSLTAYIFYSHGSAKGRPSATVFTRPSLHPDDPYLAPDKGVNGNLIRGSSTYQHNWNDILGANIDFKIGENNFTYIPGFVSFKADYLFYTGNTGNMLFINDRERQHSQELRWNRTLGPVQLSAGAFYLRNDIFYYVDQNRFTSPTAFTRVALNRTDQLSESYAGFAQAIWSVTDTLRVTGGARFSKDKIKAKGVGGAGVLFNINHAHTHPDYKIGVDFDLAPQVMVYGNIQTGYVPFGYNPDVPTTDIVPEAKLFALSGGVKSRFFDNRLELNAEAFHYSYKNFQAIQFVSLLGTSTVLNAEEATIYGVDIAARAQLTPDTQVNASLVLQRGRFDEFEGPGYNFSGNTMVYTPKVSLQLGAQHSFDLGDTGRLVARVDTRYRSAVHATFQNFANGRAPSFTKTDAAITYYPSNERWNIQAFVRNIENEAVYTTLSAASTTAVATGALEAPRTYGVRLSVNWN